jgi:hypothetical protein
MREQVGPKWWKSITARFETASLVNFDFDELPDHTRSTRWCADCGLMPLVAHVHLVLEGDGWEQGPECFGVPNKEIR